MLKISYYKLSELKIKFKGDKMNMNICIGLVSEKVEFKYFEFDNEWCEISHIKIGEVFIETTSYIDFCSLSGNYSRTDSHLYGLFVHIGDDYSEYNQLKCNDGGQYGYDFYCCLGIEEMFIETYDDISDDEIEIEEISTTSCDVTDFDFDIDEIEELEELLSI